MAAGDDEGDDDADRSAADEVGEGGGHQADEQATKPATSSQLRRLLDGDLVVHRGPGSEDRDATAQKLTWVGPRDSSSASKYSRSEKRNMPARTLDGKLWILVL